MEHDVSNQCNERDEPWKIMPVISVTKKMNNGT